MKIYVQFSDESEAEVVAVLCGPQSEESFPHQGILPDDDPRYLSFIEKFPPCGEVVGVPE